MTSSTSSFTGHYWFMNCGEGSGDGRHWDDCRRFSYMLAGGTPRHIAQVRGLTVGDRLFAYLSRFGYVGAGIVTAEAVRAPDFVPPGERERLIDLPLQMPINQARMARPQHCDWCVAIRWVRSFPREEAVLRHRFRRPTLVRIRDESLVGELRRVMGVSASEF